ncbi:GNAT family N-acetyltransferase [Mycolicibacter terrae]|nr:GNAT family N-acetyltransferase [Mycolicibacter terrae]
MGYMELFRAAQDDLAAVYDAHPYDVGLHAAIAELDMVEHGHGAIMFRGFVQSVFEIEPQCQRIIGDANAGDGSYGRRFWSDEAGCSSASTTWPSGISASPCSPGRGPVRKPRTSGRPAAP